MRKTFQSEVCKYFQGRPSHEGNDARYVTEISRGNPMKSLRNNAMAIEYTVAVHCNQSEILYRFPWYIF